MSTPDALLLLRTALSQNDTITLLSLAPDSALPPVEVFSLGTATHLSFPSALTPSTPTIVAKGIKTRYSSTPSGADYYDLQTLLLAFLQRDAGTGEYIRVSKNEGCAFVSAIERRVVVDWLAGKSELDSERITPLEGHPDSAHDEGTTVDEAGKSIKRDAAEMVAGTTVQKKSRYVVDKVDQEKVKRLLALIDGPPFGFVAAEGRPDKVGGTSLRNRETVLRGDRINNFDSVRNLATSRIKVSREETLKSSSHSTAQSSTSGGSTGKPSKRKQQTPIILISPSSTALITMHNVKRFLEDSIFESSEQARLSSQLGQTSGATEDVITVNHARTTSSISSSLSSQSVNGEVRKTRYFVVDGVEALSKFGGNGGLDEAWERVVCVMTTGQEWQFRPYKWSEPKELFHHVKGVFVQWTNDAPNPKVRSWNVTELRIDPAKRHIDKSTVADFWRGLEAWIAMNKPYLA